MEREGETREFKEHRTAAALEDIAAFANTRGGTLSVGTRDDGTIVGFEAGDTEVQRITSQLVDVLGLRPAVEWRIAPSERVLEIHGAASPGLVPCKGRYLGRVGSTNRELSPEQMAGRVMERTGQTWDAWPLNEGQAGDLIDPGAVSAFIRLARPRLPQIPAEESPERVLQNLSLSEHGRLRRAAIVLFCKPERLFPSAQVHLERLAISRQLSAFNLVVAPLRYHASFCGAGWGAEG